MSVSGQPLILNPLKIAKNRSLTWWINNGNWTEWSSIWYARFQNRTSAHNYDFRPKLHSTQFSYHFIKSILKSHNFMALNFRFWCNVPSRAGLLEIAEPETLWHLNLVCKTMSCDQNSFKHNKQTSSPEVRTKTASFMHQSSILVAWINDGKPSFLLWLRLRRLVVFGEGIWGCSRCNSAMDFFWVVKLPGLHDAQLWRVFSFKYRSMALCMILRDSSPLVSLFLFAT